MKYEYFAPVGTGRVEEWENQGWDKDDAIAYLNAYYANLILPAQQIYLRIPGAAEYWNELDVHTPSCRVQESQKRPSTISIKPGNKSPIAAAERARKNFTQSRTESCNNRQSYDSYSALMARATRRSEI
jgi:hypothetical protein